MTTSNERQQIANYVQTLGGEQVKALVLDWLSATDASLVDFKRLLETEYMHPSDSDTEELVYGELDQNLSFHPLTEEEMIHAILNTLEDYRNRRGGVPHDQVREWAGTLGADSETSCPQ
jgi:hypothetical protein